MIEILQAIVVTLLGIGAMALGLVIANSGGRPRF